MPSFGEKLKQEREKRKMSLEQISSATKIGTRLLQALEEDKFSQLPGGIFNKGFVRAYSRVVGLDEDQTVAEYMQASGDAPPPRTEIPIREDEARENEEHLRRLDASGDGSLRRMPWGWFAGFLLLIAILLSLWNRRQREHSQPVPPPTPTPTTTGAQLPASQRGSGESGKSSGTAAGAGESVASGATGSGTTGSGAAGLANSSPTSSTAPAAGDFTVVIQAREESWVSITADGKAMPSELLPAGSERTVRGQKQILVKTGNAGGVDFRYDGRRLETSGQYGEVKTVVFGPRGMLANASPAP